MGTETAKLKGKFKDLNVQCSLVSGYSLHNTVIYVRSCHMRYDQVSDSLVTRYNSHHSANN